MARKNCRSPAVARLTPMNRFVREVDHVISVCEEFYEKKEGFEDTVPRLRAGLDVFSSRLPFKVTANKSAMRKSPAGFVGVV